MENKMERLLKVNTEIKCRVNTSVWRPIVAWYVPSLPSVEWERGWKIIEMFSLLSQTEMPLTVPSFHILAWTCQSSAL